MWLYICVRGYPAKYFSYKYKYAWYIFWFSYRQSLFDWYWYCSCFCSSLRECSCKYYKFDASLWCSIPCWCSFWTIGAFWTYQLYGIFWESFSLSDVLYSKDVWSSLSIIIKIWKLYKKHSRLLRLSGLEHSLEWFGISFWTMFRKLLGLPSFSSSLASFLPSCLLFPLSI